VGAQTEHSSPRRRGLAVVAPNDLNWAAVRQLLLAMPQVDVVADLKSPKEALSCEDVEAPAAIIGAPILSGEPTLALMYELRSRWPGVRVIMLVDRHAREQAADFAEIPEASCLCWNDLSPEALEHCLLAALAAPLRMVSASIADQQGATVATPSIGGRISEKGIAVLRGLGAGLTQQQVALREGMSLRTVQRVIAELQSQFNVRSLFALGRAVEQSGRLGDHPLMGGDAIGKNTPRFQR
jgi:DNA-binding NarL/FixJ family response regulator